MTEEREGEEPLCLRHLDFVRARMRGKSGTERQEGAWQKICQMEGKVKAFLVITVERTLTEFLI